jgi:5'-nucleotidase
VPRRLVALAALGALCLAGACSSSEEAEPPTTDATTTIAPRTSSSAASAAPLRVLVTDDDGVGAPGIDALVEALRKMPDVTVIVVAPLKNQSGTGGKTTTGAFPAVTDAKTASGYPATAVAGYPADTIVWAIDKKGVRPLPDVVLSGVNFGQNIGLAIDISGTVGAARAAAQRGIPALAVSAGIAEEPAYDIAAQQAVKWLTQHRATLKTATPTVTNLNIPTCPSGKPRPTIAIVKVAPKTENLGVTPDCVTPAAKPKTDVTGFAHGYIVQTNNLSLKPPAK